MASNLNSEKLEDPLSRTAQNGLIAFNGHRPLDEPGMFNHGGNQLIVAERFIRKAEFLELRLFAAHELTRFHSQHPQNSLEFICRRWGLQILHQLGLDSVVT